MLYQPMSEAEFRKKVRRDGLKLALLSVTCGVIIGAAFGTLLFSDVIFKGGLF